METSKRKLRSSLAAAPLVMLNDHGLVEPAAKRLKTKKDEGEEMTRIIPEDEFNQKVLQIQVTIAKKPIVIDHSRLIVQIQTMPPEIQEMIRVQCITSTPNNRPFIQAFLSSSDVMLHGTYMYKAIRDTEVVLTGSSFMKEYNRLHPAVIKLARKLKIVYITEDVKMSPSEIKRRKNSYELDMKRYNDYHDLFKRNHIGTTFTWPLPDPVGTHHHKTSPMAEPRWGTSRSKFMVACRSFRGVRELTIDLSNYLAYDGVDKKQRLAWNYDNYGVRVGEHIYAVLGYSSEQYAFSPGYHRNRKDALQKLTLVLTVDELAKDEVSEKDYGTQLTDGRGYRGVYNVPAWQWLRAYFRKNISKSSGSLAGLISGYDPCEPKKYTPLTDFAMDKETGIAVYKREGYKG